MSLSGAVQLFPSDIHETSSSKQLPLGTKGETSDGRVFRYTEAGGTALDPGKLCVAATIVANHENMAVQAAAAVGDTSVSVTLGATAATADDYADGYLIINDAAGEGIAYRVSGHPAADASATLTVSLHDSVRVALTTSSQATLQKNPWKDVVVSATDQADTPTGVPNVTIAADEYGWLQTKGVCSALADETLTVGKDLTIGSSVAGALEIADGAGEPIVANAIQAGVDTEYRAVYMKID